jgi:D-alanyl-D-alanine carboxypeptidase
MALLGRALLSDHPAHYRRTFATRAFSFGQSRYRNHNRLLGVYKGMDGIKTGYTRMAGFNLVASAKRGDRRIVGVVMGSPTASTRNALMVELLNQGFRQAPQALAVSSTEPVRQTAKASPRQTKIAARRQVRPAVTSLSAKPRIAEAGRRAAPASQARLKAKARMPETARAAARPPTTASAKQKRGKADVVLGAR